MSFLSRTESVSDGINDEYTIDYPFLARDHNFVVVTPPDTEQPELYEGTITFINNGLIRLTPNPDAGWLVSRRRRTPSEQLIDILTSPSTVNADEINLIATQLLFLIQEALDAGIDLAGEGLLNIIRDLRYTYDVVIVATESFFVGERVGPIVITRNVTLEAGAPGTRGRTYKPPTGGNHVLRIDKNGGVANGGSEVGTVTVTPAGEVTVDVLNGVAFAPGDDISLVTTTDQNLDEFGITFRFRRDN